jgi:hypothetical protein
VSIRLTGNSLIDLERKIQHYLNRYHPRKYGTQVVDRGVDRGVYYAVVSREPG